jgi:hypothetical protein
MNTDQFDGHTPGPWWSGYWETDGEWVPEKGWSVEQRIVTEPRYVDHSGECVCLADNEADARLIAAAPDLLAALIEEREEKARLRDEIERVISTLRSPDPDLEDGPDYYAEMVSFLDGAICHALDILEGKE